MVRRRLGGGGGGWGEVGVVVEGKGATRKVLYNKLIIQHGRGKSRGSFTERVERASARARALPPPTMPAYSVPYVHSGDPGYAPPLLRAPSPTSSIGTDYGPDETSIIESGLSNQEFAQMCQQRLQLDSIRPDELCANFDPLLPKPKNQEEEKSACHCLFLSRFQLTRKQSCSPASCTICIFKCAACKRTLCLSRLSSAGL